MMKDGSYRVVKKALEVGRSGKVTVCYIGKTQFMGPA